MATADVFAVSISRGKQLELVQTHKLKDTFRISRSMHRAQYLVHLICGGCYSYNYLKINFAVMRYHCC